MKISTEIASVAKLIGEEKTVEYVAKAGFDAWDLSLFDLGRYDWGKQCLMQTDHPLTGPNYLAFVRQLRHIGEDNGIHCNQSHAPFPVECPAILDLQKKAIECTAEAGGKICIIHPDNKKNADENARMYEDLLSFAKSCGVKIATENMWNWDRVLDQAAPAACSDPESFNAHLDAVNDPDFVACLDLGHAEMRGLNTTAVDMIHALGSRLQALHIHDNDRCNDSHQLPFTMDMQFEPIVRALKDIGYSGYFTLEVDRYPSSFTADTAFTCVQNMAATARKLADMFEQA